MSQCVTAFKGAICYPSENNKHKQLSFTAYDDLQPISVTPPTTTIFFPTFFSEVVNIGQQLYNHNAYFRKHQQ